MQIENVSVIGAGAMGNGIAHVFALNGFKVSLVDINETVLKNAISIIDKNLDRMIAKDKISKDRKKQTLELISTSTNLAESSSSADLIIEAATENENLKLKIFKEMSWHSADHTILASNTSSLSITKMAAATSNPEQVIGMHFMNPVPIMKLVEIIRGYSTSDQTTRTIMALSRQLGKVPIQVNDYPGFVSNRILIPMINESIIALHEGVAGVEEIDAVMKLGMAHPMGPLQLADFIGLDVVLTICKVLYEGLGNSKYAPSPLLINMVYAGNLGKKSGKGFYDYTLPGKELIVAKAFVN